MLKSADIAMLSTADADVADFVARLKSLAGASGDASAVEVSMPRAKHQVIPVGVHVLRMRQLVERTKLSRATLYVLEATDPTFPKKIKLSARTIGFLESEVDSWIAARALARGATKQEAV
jgi:predicted DNA-binding transcriptional regulator AlpA